VRIVNVVCAYPPRIGGIGVAAQRHAKALAGAGHQVTVVTAAHDDPVGLAFDDGVPVHRLRPLVTHNTSALLPQLARRMRGADAVYLHYPFFGGAEPAVLGARAAGVPYVAYFHMDVVWPGWKGRALAAYDRTAAPAILRGAEAVLVSSRDYADRATIGRLGLDLVELPYGVDVERFSPPADRAASRARLGLDASRQVVLFVGGMDAGHAFKGVPELIRAFARAGLGARAQLALVGDGELRPDFEALAASEGLVGDARFLGRVDDDDLVEAYRAADLTVLPSTTGAEAFGIVLIEAMACGSPLLASDLPGVRTVVEPAGGRLVPPGDVDALARGLAEALPGPGDREARGAAVRATAVARFSSRAEAAALAEVFAGLTPRSAQPGSAGFRRRRSTTPISSSASSDGSATASNADGQSQRSAKPNG
jgi:glycosyltransferase involved in cell wall biosynthesis